METLSHDYGCDPTFSEPLATFLNHCQFDRFILMSSMKPMPPPEESISINVLFPQYRIRVISVTRSSTIAFLKESLGDSELVFNGQVLSPDQTVGFYGIQPNDSVVVIPIEPGQKEIARWVRITRDSEAFDDAVRSLANRVSRTESFRLNDLYAFRLEAHPRMFRRICRAWRCPEASTQVGKFPTQVPLGSPMLSEQPLPICW
jgi:hypothetical protein